MRVQVVADSVPTPALRELLAALAEVGLHQTAQVGLNGPECWAVTTPMLTPDQYAAVFGRLVKYEGVPVIERVSTQG